MKVLHVSWKLMSVSRKEVSELKKSSLQVNIPTAIPLVYKIDPKTMKPVKVRTFFEQYFCLAFFE